MSFQSEHPTRPPDHTRQVGELDDPQVCLASSSGTRSESLHRDPNAQTAAIDSLMHESSDDARMSEPAGNPTDSLDPRHVASGSGDDSTEAPIARSRFATPTSRTFNTPRNHADRQVHPHPSPPLSSTLNIPPSPPRPRMRRVPRQSPNARNERPAPSTLAASGFAAANLGAAPVATTSRSLRRRSSMPTVAARRTRASSLDAAPTTASRRAGARAAANRVGGSPSGSGPAHRDPDEHWLSEDEAVDTARSANRIRQPLRRRRGSGDEDDDGGDSEDGGRKLVNPLDLGLDTRARRQLHHRPAKHFNIAPVAEPVEMLSGPKLAELVPQLAKILTCPACRHLLRDPATLVCGHSRCLYCSPTPAASALSQHLAATGSSRPIAGVSEQPSAVRTPFEQPPQVVAQAVLGTPQPLPSPGVAQRLDAGMLYRTLSSSSIASTPSVASAAASVATDASNHRAHAAIACADPDCKYNFSHLVVPHRPLRIDYTLRKLVDILRRAVFGIDEYVAAVEANASKARNGEVLTPLFTSIRLGSEAPGELTSGLVSTRTDSSPEPATGSAAAPAPLKRDDSGSSGGGEDEPIAADDAKRARKTTGAWRSSKKSRPGFDEPDTAMSPPDASTPAHAGASTSSMTELPRLSLISPSLVADLQTECECQVCFQLFHEPVASPCGHSFCRNCLARSYDHSDKCPLCRADLAPLAYFRWQRSSVDLTSVIQVALPTLAAERLAAVEEEEKALLAQVPIFICTSAWPGIKCFLHIFEPRYRLMIRRALETPDRSFGMLLPVRNAAQPDAVNEYGTMLRITSCQMLEDGRLILETVGTYRFRLLERTMVDGYTVGRVERIDDVSPEQEAELEAAALAQNDSPEFQEMWSQPDDPARAPTIGGERPSRPPMTGNMELSTDQLMEICLDFIRTLRGQSAPWILERLNRTVGEMPTNPHDFTWFAAEVFPVEDHVKVVLLQITSVRERLRLIVFWIEQFRSSWWYTRGCNIA
ncbi:hypothetical protein BMF94_5270 [Rhodotorula taiwanensis]|uniref:RING-type domain-containing protein n=1 Tax=Rhodotorula taiwanensis TaxID=741276 RepID=A0A2S5B4H7_9BASI|nr:hypothetical protein BMF94_5270 [Rhodotorula taiwanensis]